MVLQILVRLFPDVDPPNQPRPEDVPTAVLGARVAPEMLRDPIAWSQVQAAIGGLCLQALMSQVQEPAGPKLVIANSVPKR